MNTQNTDGRKIIAVNKQARFSYAIEDKYEAGLVLQGTEVKSLREGRANLKESYARVRDGEIFLYNFHISEYSHGNRQNHDPLRPRKLLLHRQEIKRLFGKVSQQGYTLVPLQLYFKRGNPVNFVISSTSALFGNVFIPSETLPEQISWISKFVPLSYATEAVRGALLRGESLAELAPNLLALAGFSLILVPVGLFGARIAIRKAKREGTLVQY